jgi:hypothetical protein
MSANERARPEIKLPRAFLDVRGSYFAPERMIISPYIL